MRIGKIFDIICDGDMMRIRVGSDTYLDGHSMQRTDDALLYEDVTAGRTRKTILGKFSRRLATILCVLVCILGTTVCAFAADPAYTNADTGYAVLVEDDADLLTDSEENALVSDMDDITAFGNVAFKSIDTNYTSASSYASEYYHDTFGRSSGTLFLIDMDNRKIYIFSDGDVYGIVTRSRAETITDNVYRYASNGDYYGCASEAYSEIYTILNGNAIAQPMKYISNALLAILIALLINFIIINRVTRLRRAGIGPMIHAARSSFSYTEPEAHFINETKRYSPVEHSSGGGGGFSGGGGGGGGFSGGGGGGGGGHSF